MSAFVIRGIPGSPYVRMPLLMLEEKGAAWRLAPLSPGEQRAPEHLARHPFGKMPVLEHGDFRLYEAQAILRYLDRVLPGPSFTPVDAKAEARMNQLCGIADCYVREAVNGIGFERVVGPKLLGLTTNEDRIAALMPAAKICVDEVARLLGANVYLVGDQLSMADFMLAPMLSFFQGTPDGASLIDPYPQLGRWLERMEARPSMRRTTWERLAAEAAELA